VHKMKKLYIHLISDSSGQTVKNAAKSAMLQFANINAKEYYWPMIRNKTLLDEVIKKIQEKPGIVLYTISNKDLRYHLAKTCYELKIPCVSVISRVVREISKFLGIDADESYEYSARLDESYFDKVCAIDYTLRHDDGQMTNELEDADIILIGPSRTSKTPTSVYLSYNGFKTANVPYVHGCVVPESIYHLKKPLIVGLVINPSRLVELRETRVQILSMPQGTSYTDIQIVQEECLDVKRICRTNKWQVIDVSRKSIEETAATIIKFYYDRKTKNTL
jgi:regulator of PEP synthase PpsR (kinase-PPPase family)